MFAKNMPGLTPSMYFAFTVCGASDLSTMTFSTPSRRAVGQDARHTTRVLDLRALRLLDHLLLEQAQV